MKALLSVGLLLVSCAEPPAAAQASAQGNTCVKYHFTRQLPGTGLDASVAADGTIVAVTQLDGAHVASVLDPAGTVLGSFQLDPFTALVRAASGAELVAAAADGRVRRFTATGDALWTSQLEQRASDLVALADGGAIVSSQAERGVVSYLDAKGTVWTTLSLRTAPLLAAEETGRLTLTGRDRCTPSAPCGAGFDPNGSPTAPALEPGGAETSAVVVLDAQRRTTGGFMSSVTAGQPVGPLFVRAAFMAHDLLVVHAKAVAQLRVQAEIDVDPGGDLALRDVDTEASPDRLLAFSGRKLLWDHGIEPLDESGRAYVVAMFGGADGVVVDINGDVYDTHHIVQLGTDGRQLLRYDVPNDGIANDVRLAGIDAAARIVLSGRFEGTVDFDPGPGEDLLTAKASARRYISVISRCQ